MASEAFGGSLGLLPAASWPPGARLLLPRSLCAPRPHLFCSRGCSPAPSLPHCTVSQGLSGTSKRGCLILSTCFAFSTRCGPRESVSSPSNKGEPEIPALLFARSKPSDLRGVAQVVLRFASGKVPQAAQRCAGRRRGSPRESGASTGHGAHGPACPGWGLARGRGRAGGCRRRLRGARRERCAGISLRRWSRELSKRVRKAGRP